MCLYLFGNDRAGTDKGVVLNLHRGDKRTVRADKGMSANFCSGFIKAVIITGDGTSANIRLCANIRISQIAEVISFCASLKMGVFGFNKIADFHPLFQNCARAQACMRANNTSRLYHCPLDMAERFNTASIANAAVWPDNNMRLYHHIVAKLRICG